MMRFLVIACGLISLLGCQGNISSTGTQTTMLGRWRIGGAATLQTCEVTLKNTPTDIGWEVTNDPACPQPFSALRSWALYGDDIVLRNRAGEVVARFTPTGPDRYQGRIERGGPVTLTR